MGRSRCKRRDSATSEATQRCQGPKPASPAAPLVRGTSGMLVTRFSHPGDTPSWPPPSSSFSPIIQGRWPPAMCEGRRGRGRGEDPRWFEGRRFLSCKVLLLKRGLLLWGQKPPRCAADGKGKAIPVISARCIEGIFAF